MITSILMLLQTLPGAMLIFLIFRFPPEALLVLILIFPKKIRRSLSHPVLRTKPNA
jgi:hypothetical protein